AALRGLANSGFPSRSSAAFNAVNASTCISASARIARTRGARPGSARSRSGKEGIVLTGWVTSSTRTPSPRVDARTKAPRANNLRDNLRREISVGAGRCQDLEEHVPEDACG